MPKSTPRYHAKRVNEDITRALAEIVRLVKDYRVKDAFVTVCRTETTPDLKYCKVYYSHLNGVDREVKAGLYSAMGYIRKELSSRLKLRVTPELTFIRDDGLEKGARIASLLKKIDELSAAQADEAVVETTENE